MSDYCRNYKLYRLTLTLANTEYSQVLNTRPTYVRVHSEDLMSQIRISFTALGSATGEVVFAGSEWKTPAALAGANKTIYMQSPNPGVIIDIIEFEV